MDRALRAASLLLLAAIVSMALAQQPNLKKYPDPRIRFNNELRVGPHEARVQADLRAWILPPGLKAERLPLPAEASVVIELHAGKLETLTGDRREPRSPGDIWLLRPGESIMVNTHDDSVTLTTLAITPR
jgi:hypothetical protein